MKLIERTYTTSKGKVRSEILNPLFTTAEILSREDGSEYRPVDGVALVMLNRGDRKPKMISIHKTIEGATEKANLLDHELAANGGPRGHWHYITYKKCEE